MSHQPPEDERLLSGDLPFTLERLWRTRSGLWGMVVLNPVGFRNGYVHLPDGISTDDARLVPVHGGITFRGPYPARQLENGDGVPDGDWIGWDHGHYLDAPEPEMWAAATGGHRWPVQGHLWTTDEVAEEVERTALLVSALEAYHGKPTGRGAREPRRRRPPRD